MKWHSETPNAPKILYLRIETVNNGAWMPYTAFSHLMVPDYEIEGGSKGWATYQKLLNSGFSLVASGD